MTSKSDNLRYSIIPARAITDPNVTAQALRVLALLGRHTDDNGWCRRSQVKMAKELGCSRGTIQNALDLLIGQENGTGYIERREETRPGVEPVEDRHPHCSYSYRVRLDLDDEARAGASRLAGGRANQKAGGAKPDKHPVPIPLAPITEPSPCERPLDNTLAPADAAESGNIASLKEPETDRFPDFRQAVFHTWPGGFPADNEVAAQKAWDRVTREHPAELVVACARLHGEVKTAASKRRRAGDGKEMVKLPANWLKGGDWQGYIPRAEAAVAAEAAMVTALGNVRRALGDGLFDLLRHAGMADTSLAMLDGMTHEPPAHFTITRSFQRTLVDRYEPQVRRHTGSDLSFTLVPKAVAS